MDVHIPFRRFSLANGLNVIVHTDRTLPVVTVNLWYHVGSKNERPGRTGFAHLFEHIMFEGSAHVPAGAFDDLLESVGGVNNGSTNPDRTNYWENLPSNALELALWLEADRMGWLLDTMDQAKLDIQRDVVKNERRQSYENRPYGLAFERIGWALYPPDHPYHWSTIGSMSDLEAATLEDVAAFFTRYYAPNNASMAIAGDVSASTVEALSEKYFGAIPRGEDIPPVVVDTPRLERDAVQILEDDVPLARLYMAWHSPAVFGPGDADLDVAAMVLADGKSSRLYRRLVYEAQVATDVGAYQFGQELGGRFMVIVTARPGVALGDLETAVREEIASLAAAGPDDREIERSLNQIEAGFVESLERVGGFGGKADQLNRYFITTGDPGYSSCDLDRYHALDAASVADAVRTHLLEAHTVVLSVVPAGRTELAAERR